MSKKDKEGEEPGLGELETDVMKVIWQSNWVAVRDVYERLRLERTIAYTTVMTVMGRLHEKGLLARRQEGRTYHYQAKQTRLEVARGFMRKLLERMFDGRKADAMAALLDSADRIDDAELGEIKRQISNLEHKSGPEPKPAAEQKKDKGRHGA